MSGGNNGSLGPLGGYHQTVFVDRSSNIIQQKFKQKYYHSKMINNIVGILRGIRNDLKRYQREARDKNLNWQLSTATN